MSSLLDILQRKDTRPNPDPSAEDTAAEAVEEPTAQFAELRLAVDNGPPTGPEEIPAHASTATFDTIAHGSTAESTDPFATFHQPASGHSIPGDNAGRLTAAKLRERSRRSTVWLGAGLALIILAAGAATWLLNEVEVETASNSSLFVIPGADMAPMPAVAPTEPDRTPPAPTPATNTSSIAAEDPDTAWFDAQAIEEPVTAPDAVVTEPIRIVRGTTTNPLFPKLTEAWTAFQSADYARAEALYREVHTADAANVDALLGLGAIAARGNRTDEARDSYQAALLADPKNATANSALSTMPATGTGNLDESALKNLLREQPGAANLHFVLGVQYVAQGRWPDAQSAFFEAVKNEPTNADYAYNLAVSLDRLRQSGPAAAYYQRALELATASALFNPGAARERLAILNKTAP